MAAAVVSLVLLPQVPSGGTGVRESISPDTSGNEVHLKPSLVFNGSLSLLDLNAVDGVSIT